MQITIEFKEHKILSLLENPMDVLSALEGFLQIIPETLIDGYSVDLGDFGIMSLTAKSKAAETEEEFNVTYIEGVKVNFRPGKIFNNALNNAEYTKIHDVVVPQ